MTRSRTNGITALAGLVLALACAMVLATVRPAFAADAADLDLSEKGSISVTMRESGSGKAVAGGDLSVVRVGDIARDGAGLAFVATPETAESGLGFDDLESSELAQEYADFATANNMPLITREVSSDATVSFEGLPLGVYLVMQKTPAEGYNAILPFLVTVPSQENGTWMLDVDATPKVELYTTPLPKTPEKPSTPSPSGKLPQTGQLNWPIPVLGGAGAAMLVLGYVFLRRSRANGKWA